MCLIPMMKEPKVLWPQTNEEWAKYSLSSKRWRISWMRLRLARGDEKEAERGVSFMFYFSWHQSFARNLSDTQIRAKQKIWSKSVWSEHETFEYVYHYLYNGECDNIHEEVPDIIWPKPKRWRGNQMSVHFYGVTNDDVRINLFGI